MTKRKYERDTERYPLAASDPRTHKYRWRLLLALWRKRSGGKSTYADLSRELGCTYKQARDWFGLGKFGGMDSEAVEKVCKLFNVSLEYLQNGKVYTMSQSVWDAHKPTTAESDRYDAKGIADAYSILDESEQRTITQMINTMLELKRYKGYYIGSIKDIERLLDKVLSGKASEEEITTHFNLAHESLLTEESTRVIVTRDYLLMPSEWQDDWSRGEEESIDQDIDNLKKGRLDEVSYLEYLEER